MSTSGLRVRQRRGAVALAGLLVERRWLERALDWCADLLTKLFGNGPVRL